MNVQLKAKIRKALLCGMTAAILVGYNTAGISTAFASSADIDATTGKSTNGSSDQINSLTIQPITEGSSQSSQSDQSDQSDQNSQTGQSDSSTKQNSTEKIVAEVLGDDSKKQDSSDQSSTQKKQDQSDQSSTEKKQDQSTTGTGSNNQNGTTTTGNSDTTGTNSGSASSSDTQTTGSTSTTGTGSSSEESTESEDEMPDWTEKLMTGRGESEEGFAGRQTTVNEATMEYEGELDIVSGNPLNEDGTVVGDEEVREELASNLFYDKSNGSYVFVSQRFGTEIYANVANGMITQSSVSIIVPEDVTATLYMDGEAMPNDTNLNVISEPGSYVLRIGNGGYSFLHDSFRRDR